MSDQSDQGEQRTDEDRKNVMGTTDHPQHRAAPDEGAGAPFAAEAGHAEFSVFDGRGNESVVVVTENEEGKVVESAGESSDEAMKKAPKQEGIIPPAFHTDPHHK